MSFMHFFLCHFLQANFGGHGYSHILRNVVPQMRIKGFKEEEIDVILKHNPQRWLARGQF